MENNKVVTLDSLTAQRGGVASGGAARGVHERRI